ncbi:WD40-repeat-containing domain protein [Tricharina praecox]|uniref:WD40-repeat-containing domain protein n=1 Tax=Tricharina praecox TaxID=43433 RepID=UPI00221F7921|nr:WD40-repeat-containing domain protein [Tricharina praecox]KAI5855382.1 WD40-repeat-containing domain protein [Tricharina praecox]
MATPTPSQSSTTAAEPPACLSFVPHDPTLLLVGTYTLHESATTLASKKTGTLCLYRVPSLAHVDTLTTSYGAVLDVKFSPASGELAAVALSRGVVTLVRVLDERIVVVRHVRVVEEAVLLLSVAWAPGGDAVAVTTTDGRVLLVGVGGEDEGPRWEATPHSLEAWTVEFSPCGRRVYSGGDDAVLVVTDVETAVELGRTRRGAHEAGVTAVMARGADELWSGSYDETLRVWDLRGRMRAVEEKGLGGGVWRLHEMVGGRVLASCMHAGARVVERGGTGVQIVARWEENESMNYGGHVHPDAPGVVASCSFYDKKVAIWNV